MRIGFDASVMFSSVGGTKVYATQLLSALMDSQPRWEYLLYARNETQNSELRRQWSGPNVKPVVVPGSPNVWRLQARLPAQLRRDGVDLYHSFGSFLPLGWTGPRVVTIHDVNVYLRWQNWMRPSKVLNWADMALQVPLAVRAADRIVTGSHFSKDSICRVLRIDPAKITVIPYAPDPYFDEAPTDAELAEASPFTRGTRFVLYVGILSSQKNLGTLIRAFAASELRSTQTRLVVAGSDKEGEGENLRRIARSVGIEERLVLPGFISRLTLRVSYRKALCVVLPSFGEGFGLPLVEAMASGTPVIAARTQAMPEVVGGAGLLFDPDDTRALTEHLNRLATDDSLRSDLIERGHRRRAEFSWSSAARATAAVYEEVLSSRR